MSRRMGMTAGPGTRICPETFLGLPFRTHGRGPYQARRMIGCHAHAGVGPSIAAVSDPTKAPAVSTPTMRFCAVEGNRSLAAADHGPRTSHFDQFVRFPPSLLGCLVVMEPLPFSRFETRGFRADLFSVADSLATLAGLPGNRSRSRIFRSIRSNSE